MPEGSESQMSIGSDAQRPLRGYGATARTVGAALRGRPCVELTEFKEQQPRHRRTRLVPRRGGHGGPPLQYVPHFEK